MKTRADYTVVVAPDADAFFAYAPAIDGCYAAGDSPEEARGELEHVFSMICEEHIEEGSELPEDVGEILFASALPPPEVVGRRAPSRYNHGVKTLADYTVVVMPDDGTFVAYVPAIPGCHAIGDTPEEARRELDGVFGMWQDYLAERGTPMPDDVKELIPVAS